MENMFLKKSLNYVNKWKRRSWEVNEETSKGLSKTVKFLFYPEENVESIMTFSSHIINISAKCHFLRDVFLTTWYQNEKSSNFFLVFIFPHWHWLPLIYLSNTLATWCKELTHWKRPWCWESLKAGGKGNDGGQEVGGHHRLEGHEFEQAPGDVEGQGSLACCSPQGRKELDMTEQLNNKYFRYLLNVQLSHFPVEFKLHISKDYIFLFLFLLSFTAAFAEPTILPGNRHVEMSTGIMNTWIVYNQ